MAAILCKNRSLPISKTLNGLILGTGDFASWDLLCIRKVLDYVIKAKIMKFANETRLGDVGEPFDMHNTI